MSIKFNELPMETQVKFRNANADGIVTIEEWSNFSKEEQKLLTQALIGESQSETELLIKNIRKNIQLSDEELLSYTSIQSYNNPKQERAELSWGEIGKQGLKSVGNFFKGMVCDEEGFSLKRTATTVGMGLGFTALALVSAPAALVAGAVMGGYMAINGGKNLIEGTIEYYNATTHEEAVAAMEKAMDGGVETAGGVAALFGVRKGYSATKSAKAKPVQTVETKPVPAAETEAPLTDSELHAVLERMSARRKQKYAEEVKAKANTTQMRQTKDGSLIEETFNAEGRVTRSYRLYEDGHSYEVFKNNYGAETKNVWTNADGTKKITTEYVKDGATRSTKIITTTVENGKTSVVETTRLENGLTKSVHKAAEGRLNKVEYHDLYGNLVKTTMEDPRLIGFEVEI